MSEEAVERIRIEGSPTRCFEVVCDFERYPQWATDVKKAEILERDDDGRGAQVRYEVSAMNLTIGYTLAYDYSEAPGALSWTLVESEMLRKLDGTYRFDADTDGAATAVTYRLVVDLALPLPGFMKKKAAEKIASNAMKEFKKFVEAGA